MSNFEFIHLLNSNFLTYLFILLVNMLLFLFLFRKKYQSIFDPLFYQCVILSFVNSVVPFLYVTGVVTLNILTYCLLCTCVFLVAFLFRFKRIVFPYSHIAVHTPTELYGLYIFCCLFIIIVKLYEYSTVGIGIFLESRFVSRQNFVVSLLNRLLMIPHVFCIIYTYHIFNDSLLKNKRIIGVCVLIVVFLFDFLKGSKGFVLQYIFLFFIYFYFFSKKKIHVKKKYLILLAIFPIVVVMLYYGNQSVASSFEILIYRFVVSGDIMWQGFANNVVDGIENTAPWYERVFSFILGPLGLVSQNAKIPLGTLILGVNNQGILTTLEGGNSVIPMFTWVCLGWGGLVLSFGYGLLCRGILSFSMLSVSSDILGCSICACFYLQGITIFNDPVLYCSCLFDIVVGILLLNIWSFFFCKGRGLVKFKTNYK